MLEKYLEAINGQCRLICSQPYACLLSILWPWAFIQRSLNALPEEMGGTCYAERRYRARIGLCTQGMIDCAQG